MVSVSECPLDNLILSLERLFFPKAAPNAVQSLLRDPLNSLPGCLLGKAIFALISIAFLVVLTAVSVVVGAVVDGVID